MSRSLRVPGIRERIIIEALLGGVVLGVIQPAFVTAFYGLGVVVGPTIVGLILLVSVLLAAASGLAALVAPWRAAALSTFLVCGCLTVGIIGGNVVGAVLGVGFRSSGPANRDQPYASFSFTPPRFFQSQGTVVLNLDQQPGFTPTSTEGIDGGLFGHWCYSAPDSEAVAEVDAVSIGNLKGQSLGVFIFLNPSERTARVTLQFNYTEEEVVPIWSGSGRLVDYVEQSGRVTFEGLPSDPTVTGWPTTLSGEVSWECAPWPDTQRD